MEQPGDTEPPRVMTGIVVEEARSKITDGQCQVKELALIS